MRRVFWITSAAAAAGVIYGLNVTADRAERVASAQTSVVQTPNQVAVTHTQSHERFQSFGQTGSALATAAFGMSALQPETYDGDMVADIIAASPLEELEKVQLTSNLRQAESGYADLNDVLSDVRSALAIE